MRSFGTVRTTCSAPGGSRSSAETTSASVASNATCTATRFPAPSRISANHASGVFDQTIVRVKTPVATDSSIDTVGAAAPLARAVAGVANTVLMAPLARTFAASSRWCLRMTEPHVAHGSRGSGSDAASPSSRPQCPQTTMPTSLRPARPVHLRRTAIGRNIERVHGLVCTVCGGLSPRRRGLARRCRE